MVKTCSVKYKVFSLERTMENVLEKLPQVLATMINEKLEHLSRKLESQEALIQQLNCKILDHVKREEHIDTKLLAMEKKINDYERTFEELDTEVRKICTTLERQTENNNEVKQMQKLKDENVVKILEKVAKELKLQYSSIDVNCIKLNNIMDKQTSFSKTLDQCDSNVKTICKNFEDQRSLDASMDKKLDSSLVYMRNVTFGVEKLKHLVGSCHSVGMRIPGSYSNWSLSHDKLLHHNFLPCDDFLATLSDYMMHENDPNALLDLENNINAVKQRCIKITNATRFPDNGLLYADLDDTQMSVSFTNFIEAIKSQSRTVVRSWTMHMINTFTAPDMVKFGIFDCSKFEKRYGLKWTIT